MKNFQLEKHKIRNRIFRFNFFEREFCHVDLDLLSYVAAQTGEATFRSHRVKKVINEEIKIMMNITKIRDWMRKELSLNFEEYNDCGEIDCTLLAENCCEELDGYEGEDYDIPEEFYDLAVEIAENFEEDE